MPDDDTGRTLTHITEAFMSAVLSGLSLLVVIGMGVTGIEGIVSKVVAIAASLTTASFLAAMYAQMALAGIGFMANAKNGAALFPAFVAHAVAFHIGLFGLLFTLGAAGFLFGTLVGLVASACAGLAGVFVCRMALWAKDASA